MKIDSPKLKKQLEVVSVVQANDLYYSEVVFY